MEINNNSDGIGSVGRLSPYARTARSHEAASADGVDFASSERLEKALASTPDVRAEEVRRAKALVGQVDYPPMETINKISNLLALNIVPGE